MNEPEIDIPKELAAERLIIGCMMGNNDIIPELLTQLTPDEFFHPIHKSIWRAFRNLDLKRETIDIVTVSRTIQTFNEVPDYAYISSLLDGIPKYSRASYLSSHVSLVKEASGRRDLLRIGSWIQATALAKDISLDEFLAQTLQRIQVVHLLQRTQDDLIHSSDAMNRTLAELEERWSRGSEMLGLSTGFRQLDEVTGGLRGGRYYVLAAGTGMGKTTLALNVANNIMLSQRSYDKKCAGLIISLEMSVTELNVKMLGTSTRINTRKIETGQLNEEEKRKLILAADLLSDLDIEYCEGFSKVTPSSLLGLVEKVRTRHGQIDFLVVDYLQLIDSGAGSKAVNDHEKISNVSRELKRISIRFNIPVLVLSQVNRKSADRTNKDYQLSDLRGSGSIEQDADLVAFLQPDDWSDERNNKRKLYIAKQRAGVSDVSIPLIFFKESSRFAEYEPEF